MRYNDKQNYIMWFNAELSIPWYRSTIDMLFSFNAVIQILNAFSLFSSCNETNSFSYKPSKFYTPSS